jgi:hypothetical protein
MSVKTHIAHAPEPLKEHVAVVALCGQHVPDAAFVVFVDSSHAGLIKVHDLIDQLSGNSAIGVCRKCLDREVEERYIYAIREGKRE